MVGTEQLRLVRDGSVVLSVTPARPQVELQVALATLAASSPYGGFSQARLSLVQLLHYCALIGRDLYSVIALLSHKEPAQGIQSPLLGASLAFRFMV